MKALHFIAALLFISSLTNAQDEKGIKFEKGLNWEQIREKAKKENKYIFLDGFTTWCAPCKMMAKEIFPQPTVGEFFNKNFINVAVQFDVTKKDNPDVKGWYKDAAKLKKHYKINSFPTYLFLNPQGELVHSVYEASSTGDEFITKAKQALDPKIQYLSLKRQFEAGKQNPGFILILVKSAIKNRDKTLVEDINSKYFNERKDLSNPDNLNILALTTKKISDPGFAIFRDSSALADQTIGAGKSSEIVKSIIFDEMILPVLKVDGKKIDNGSIIAYTGVLSRDVNWDSIKIVLEREYPVYSDEIMKTAKLTYLDWSENWLELSTEVSNFLSEDKYKLDKFQLNNFAANILRLSDNQKVLEEALGWSKLNLECTEDLNQKLLFLDTYANLLYKTEKKADAIKQIQYANTLTNGKNTYFIDVLAKMKKGEKTW